MDFDARERFDVDDVALGQNEVNAGGGGGGGEFAADDDDDVMDEDDYDDDGAQAGLARKAGLREMLAKARGENLDQQWNSNQALPEKGKKPAYNRPNKPSDPPLKEDDEPPKIVAAGLATIDPYVFVDFFTPFART